MSVPSSLIREARRRAALSQRELAERVGSTQPAIARIESGRGSVTVDTIERLVGAAGFDLVLDITPRLPIDPVTAVYQQDVDRSLLRQNRKRTVNERLRSGAEMVTGGQELQQAMSSVSARKARAR
jgi:transcriptional regulator with XRE-family HTH domain